MKVPGHKTQLDCQLKKIKKKKKESSSKATLSHQILLLHNVFMTTGLLAPRLAKTVKAQSHAYNVLAIHQIFFRI